MMMNTGEMEEEEEAALVANVRQKATDECIFYRPRFYSPSSLYRTCGQHIVYADVRSSADDGSLPCLLSHGCPDLCAQGRFRTDDEVEQAVQEQVEVYHTWMKERSMSSE